ncbi:MAG: photosystem II S4 domain protein [Dethiobacter sp.]|nr:photosystem II S4 domain protein [Dethiobacter sp.]
MDRESLLARFEQDMERFTAAAVLDRIEQVERTGQAQAGDFLDPYLQRAAERVLNISKHVKFLSWGGYPGAERVRHLIFPAARQAKTTDVPLSCVEASASGAENELTHRDFLGAVLGLGLRREKVGDIIITAEGAAQLIVAPDVLPFLLSSWTHVGRHSITVKEITSEELRPAVVSVREIKATVASLRLDSVASAGFGLSRSKVAPAIRAGLVKLNWQSVKNASASLKEGDVISLAGRGRVELAAVTGESKKGRLQILLKKLL